jgi:hypothetical protein
VGSIGLRHVIAVPPRRPFLFHASMFFSFLILSNLHTPMPMPYAYALPPTLTILTTYDGARRRAVAVFSISLVVSAASRGAVVSPRTGVAQSYYLQIARDRHMVRRAAGARKAALSRELD